jgi:hypothetical protein
MQQLEIAINDTKININNMGEGEDSERIDFKM